MCVFNYDRISRLLLLDLDRMTLIPELDLAILKMYLLTKTKFVAQGFQKLDHEQTDRQTRPNALHTRIHGY